LLRKYNVIPASTESAPKKMRNFEIKFISIGDIKNY